MADKTTMLRNILEEASVNALTVIGARAVLQILGDPAVDPRTVQWVKTYAKNTGEIRAAMMQYAIFIASIPAMGALDGDFSLAGGLNVPTEDDVLTAMVTTLTAYTTAA